MTGDGDLLIQEPDYEGTIVTCSEGRWATKIEAQHPELVGRHAEAAEVLREPHFVFQDRDYGDRRQHYRLLPNGRYLKVVVEYRYYEGDTRARIVTAFEQSNLRIDDKPLFVNVRR